MFRTLFRCARLCPAPFRPLLALLASSLALLPHAFAASGHVIFVDGPGTLLTAAGASRTLTRGQEINPGDTLETGANARAQIRFTDGGTISLHGGSRFRVDGYVWNNTADGTEKGRFNLLQGALRAVTGAIGRVNRESYTMVTPTATIGIRGTGFLARLNGQQLEVRVSEGEISVANSAGSIAVPVGRTAVVPGPTFAPQLVFTQLQLPPTQPQAIGDTPFVAAENRGASGASSILGGHGGAAGVASGAITAPLAQSSGVEVVYSAGAGTGGEAFGIGTDQRNGVNLSLDAEGRMTGYLWPTNPLEAPQIGTNLVAELGGDATLTWGRWNGGTMAGQFFSMALPTYDGNQGFHYLAGIPTAAMPTTGTATYSLLGATHPTGGGMTGSLTGGLAFDFAAQSVGVDLSVAMPDRTYHLLSTGGLANPASSEVKLGSAFYTGNAAYAFGGNINLAAGGTACAGTTCAAYIRGFAAGDNASHAGLAYTIGGGSPDANSVHGVAAFKQSAP